MTFIINNKKWPLSVYKQTVIDNREILVRDLTLLISERTAPNMFTDIINKLYPENNRPAIFYWVNYSGFWHHKYYFCHPLFNEVIENTVIGIDLVGSSFMLNTNMESYSMESYSYIPENKLCKYQELIDYFNRQ